MKIRLEDEDVEIFEYFYGDKFIRYDMMWIVMGILKKYVYFGGY